MSTSGAHVAIAAWRSLTPDERHPVFLEIQPQHLRDRAEQETIAERMVRSVATVAAYVGSVDVLSPKVYKKAAKELQARGEDIAPFHVVTNDFSWAQVKEAAALSEAVTPARIGARFESRKLGKILRYSDQALKDAVMDRSAELDGRPPRLGEFTYWRERELEKARTLGKELHLPSGGPYRKRWGDWEGALAGVGFTPEQIRDRFTA